MVPRMAKSSIWLIFWLVTNAMTIILQNQWWYESLMCTSTMMSLHWKIKKTPLRFYYRSSVKFISRGEYVCDKFFPHGVICKLKGTIPVRNHLDYFKGNFFTGFGGQSVKWRITDTLKLTDAKILFTRVTYYGKILKLRALLIHAETLGTEGGNAA